MSGQKAPPPVILTDEQKAYVAKHCTTKGMDLKTLTQQVFANPSLDGRSMEAKAVKEHIATLGRPALKTLKDGATPFELTQDQRDFIDANIHAMDNAREIARALFKNPTMPSGTREVRAVSAYCRKMYPEVYREEEEVDEAEYTPPNSIIYVIGKLNRCLPHNRADGKAMFDRATITAHDEKNLRALLGYMNIPRFKIEADKYLKKIDRELYETSFMQFTYDKPDLLMEELHQYVSLAAEIVLTHQIDKTVQKLDQRVNDNLDDPDAKIGMAEVELLNSMREKLNKSKEQQSKLIDKLVGARSDRLDKKLSANATILNLVEAWKMEDRRKELLELAEMERLIDKEEVNRLSDMDSVMALISGISKEDALGAA